MARCVLLDGPLFPDSALIRTYHIYKSTATFSFIPSVPISCWNLFYSQTFSFPLKFLSYTPRHGITPFRKRARQPPPLPPLTSLLFQYLSLSSIMLSLSLSISCRHKIRINGKDILSLHQPFAITAVRCCMGLRIRVLNVQVLSSSLPHPQSVSHTLARSLSLFFYLSPTITHSITTLREHYASARPSQPIIATWKEN